MGILLLLSTSEQLSAHDFWIEPSRFSASAGAAIAIDLKVGEGFRGQSVPRRSGSLDRFSIYTESTPSGDDVSGPLGLVPAGMALTDGGSAALIAYDGGGGVVELPPDRFDIYLRNHGLEWVIGDREKRGEAGRTARERFHRHAKALLAGRHRSPLAEKIVGQTLELVPDSDPTQMGDAPFAGHVLWRGRRLSGCLVIARSRQKPDQPITTRSEADGGFQLSLQGGVWLLQAVWMERRWLRRDEWDSHWASLTFQRPDIP